MPKDAACPVCDADLVLAGDERRGDTVVCVYCSAPFTVVRPPDDEEELELEEEF